MGDTKKIMQVRSARQVPTRVLLLDDEFLDVGIDKRAVGGRLFDIVCEHLNILEKDYFGLNYRDAAGYKFWLNNDKKISKQMKGQNWAFNFEVKFYPADPTQLAEDLTRYQLCLQIRRDVVNERAPCSFVTYTLLGSYTAQSEMGDYDTEEFGSGYKYLKDIKFAPKQDRELLMKIAELHRQHKGQTPEESEQHFLENAKKLAMYGIELHHARDAEGKDISIGVGASGITIYKDKMQVNRFVWPKVLKISYRRQKFYIKIRPGEFETFASLIGFRLENVKMAKRLWKICVEHHSFFRFREPEEPKSVSIFPRFGSRFRYSGLTQFQSRQLVTEENRDCPSFDRVLSKRGTFSGRTANQRKRDDDRHQRRQELKRAPVTSPRQTEVPPPIPASNVPPLPASGPPEPRPRTPPEPKHAPPIAPKPKLRGSRDNLSVDKEPPASLNDSFEDVPDRRSKMEKMHAVATPLAAVLKQKSIDMEKERDKHLESDNSSRGPPGYTSDDPDGLNHHGDHHREVGKFSESSGSLSGAGRLNTNNDNEKAGLARFRKSDLESEGLDSARSGLLECGDKQAKIDKDALTGKGKHDDSGIYLFSYPSSSIDSILSTDFADYEAESNKPEKWQTGTGSEENLYLSGLQQKEGVRNSRKGLRSHYSAENISSASSSENYSHISHADGIYAEIDDVKAQANRLEESKQIISDKPEFSRTRIQSEPIRGRRSKLYTKNQKSKPTATINPVPVQEELKDVAIKSVLTSSNNKTKDSKSVTPHYAQIHKMSDKLKQFLKDKPKHPSKSSKSKDVGSKDSNKTKNGGSKESGNTSDKHIVTGSDHSSLYEEVDPESRSKLREELKMYILHPGNLPNKNIISHESQLERDIVNQNQFGKSFTVEAELHKEHGHGLSLDVDEQNDTYMQMTNVGTLPTGFEVCEEISAPKPLKSYGADSSHIEQLSHSNVQQPDQMKDSHSCPEKLFQNDTEEQGRRKNGNKFGHDEDSVNEANSTRIYELQTVPPEVTETVDSFTDISKSKRKGTETENSANRMKGKNSSDVIQNDEERQVRFKLPDAEDTIVQNTRMPTETEISIDPFSEMVTYDEEPGSNRRYMKEPSLPKDGLSLSNIKGKIMPTNSEEFNTVQASKQIYEDYTHSIKSSEGHINSKPESQNLSDHVYENLPQVRSSSNLDSDKKSESEYVDPDQFFNTLSVDSMMLDTSLENSSVGSTRQRLEDTSLSSLYQLTFDGSSLSSPDQSLSRDSIGYSDMRNGPIVQRSLEDQDLERFCTLSSGSSDLDEGMLMAELDRELEKVCSLSTDSSDAEQDSPLNLSNKDNLKAIKTKTVPIQPKTSPNLLDVSRKNVNKKCTKSDNDDAIEKFTNHGDDRRSKNYKLTTKPVLKENIDEKLKDPSQVSIPYNEQLTDKPANYIQSSQNNFNTIPVKGIQDTESEQYAISVKPTSREIKMKKKIFDCEIYAEEPYNRRPGLNQSSIDDDDDDRTGFKQSTVGKDRNGPDQLDVDDGRSPDFKQRTVDDSRTDPKQSFIDDDRTGRNKTTVGDDRSDFKGSAVGDDKVLNLKQSTDCVDRPGPKQYVVGDDERPGLEQSTVCVNRPDTKQPVVGHDKNPDSKQSSVGDDMKASFSVNEDQKNVRSQPLVLREVLKMNDIESQWQEDRSVEPNNLEISNFSEDGDNFSLTSGEQSQISIESVGTNKPMQKADLISKAPITALRHPQMSKESSTVSKHMEIVEEMRKADTTSCQEKSSLSSSNAYQYHTHLPYSHKDSNTISPNPDQAFTKSAESNVVSKPKGDRSQVHLPAIGTNVFDRISKKLTITDSAKHSCKKDTQQDIGRKSAIYSPRNAKQVKSNKFSSNAIDMYTDSKIRSDTKSNGPTMKVPFKRNPIRTVAIIEGSKVFREDEKNPKLELMPDQIISGNIKYVQGTPIASKNTSADIQNTSFSDDSSMETSSLSGTGESQQSGRNRKSKHLSKPRDGKKISPGVIHMINPCQVGWIEGGLQSSPRPSRKIKHDKSNTAISCLDFEPAFVDLPSNRSDRIDAPISSLDFDLTSNIGIIEEIVDGTVTCEDAGNDSGKEIEVSAEILSTAPASDLLCKRVWKYARKGPRDGNAMETNDNDSDDDEFDKAINKGPYFESENQDGANYESDGANFSLNEPNLDSYTGSSVNENDSSSKHGNMSENLEEQQFIHNMLLCDGQETMIPVDQREIVLHKKQFVYSEKNNKTSKSNILGTPYSIKDAEEVVMVTDLDDGVDHYGFGLRNSESVEHVDREELSQSSTDSESEGEEIISFEMPTQKHETEFDGSLELHTAAFENDGSRNSKCSTDSGACTNAELLDDSFAIDCSFETIKSYKFDNEGNESNVQESTMVYDNDRPVLTTDLDDDDPDDDFDIFGEDSDYDDDDTWYFPVPEIIEEHPFKPAQSNLKSQQKKETLLFERRVHFQKDLPVYKSLKNVQTLDVREDCCDAMPQDLDKDKMEYFENFITCLFDKEPRNLSLENQMEINEDSERDRCEDIITSNKKRLLNQRRKLDKATREDPAESEDLWYFNSEILQEDVFENDDDETQTSIEMPEPESDLETLQSNMSIENKSISIPEMDVENEAKTSFRVPTQEFEVELSETSLEGHLGEIHMKNMQDDIQVENNSGQIITKHQYDRPIISGFQVLREPLSKSKCRPGFHQDTGLKKGIPQIAKPITGRRQKQHSISDTIDVRTPKTNYPIEAKVELEDIGSKAQPKHMTTAFAENCAVDSKVHDEHPYCKQDDTAAQAYVHLHSVSKSTQPKVFDGIENVDAKCIENDFEKTKLDKDLNSQRKPGNIHKHSPERTKYTYAVSDESNPDSPKIKYVTYEYITEYKLDNVKIHYQRNQTVQTDSGDDTVHPTETFAKVVFPSTDINTSNLEKKTVSDMCTDTERDHMFDMETGKGTQIEVEEVIEKSVCYPLGPVNSLPLVYPDHLGNAFEIEEHIEKSICHKLGSREKCEVVEEENSENEDPDEVESSEVMENVKTVSFSSDVANMHAKKSSAKFDVPMLLINGYGGGNNHAQRLNKDVSNDNTLKHQSVTEEKSESNINVTKTQNGNSLSFSGGSSSTTVGSKLGSVKSVKGHNAKQIIEHNSQKYVWQSFEPDTATSLHKRRIEFGNSVRKGSLPRRWTVEGSCSGIQTSHTSKLRDAGEETSKVQQGHYVSKGQKLNKDVRELRAISGSPILQDNKSKTMNEDQYRTVDTDIHRKSSETNLDLKETDTMTLCNEESISDCRDGVDTSNRTLGCTKSNLISKYKVVSRERTADNDKDEDTACETIQECSSAQSMVMGVDGNDGSVYRCDGSMYCAVMQEQLPALQIEEMTQETLNVVQAMAVVALGAVLVFLLPYMG